MPPGPAGARSPRRGSGWIRLVSVAVWEHLKRAHSGTQECAVFQRGGDKLAPHPQRAQRRTGTSRAVGCRRHQPKFTIGNNTGLSVLLGRNDRLFF